MSNRTRVGLTWMIWIAGIALTFIFMSNAIAGLLDDWLVIVPLIVALFSTVTFWGVGTETDDKELPSLPRDNKQGDSTAYTMALLMEMMDEDERYEFKSQLKRRILSGETVMDESIIMDMEKRKRG